MTPMNANAGFLIGLVASILAGVGAVSDAFPLAWKPYIILASVVGTATTGYMARSPFPHDPPKDS